MALYPHLKRRIAARQPVVGTWLTMAHPSVAEVLAAAGFDFVVIDQEHTAITPAETLRLLCALDGAGVATLVRVGANDPLEIKRALDAGAAGVIVPMVCSAEEAAAAVSAAHYPPTGTRGIGLARAQGYGAGFAAYRDASADVVVVAQIEHIDAIERLEGIVAVEGLDATMIGPYDLSGSLGAPGDMDAPAVREALARYERVCDAAGAAKGAHAVDADPAVARARLDAGYTFVAAGVDFLLLADAARRLRAGL